MQVFYEGTDITEHAEIVELAALDCAGGRADALEMTMQNAGKWYSWGPKKDDIIEITENGYSTGRMYLDSVMPDNGKYRVVATSMPSGARQRRWQAFENRSLGELMRAVCAELKMDFRIYGLDENARYPFMIRKNESGPAFLSRVLRLEGAVLKCVAGRLAAIGITYCQSLSAARELEITSETPGIRHTKTEGAAYAGINVITPYANGAAMDANVDNGLYLTLQDEPAGDNAQAARWARGALLWENRQAESLSIPMEFDSGITAMLPILVSGDASLAGRWMVESAEHDFINRRTLCGLTRCVTSIR